MATLDTVHSSVDIEILEEDARSLASYASVAIAFRVTEVLDLDRATTAGSVLPGRIRAIAAPYVKDYDAYPGNSPRDWPMRFDISRWDFLAAYVSEQRVGGAVIIARDPRVEFIEERDDLAVLWDLRVAPPFRRRGVGGALLGAVEAWARARRSGVLQVETQNTNVPACRFYARHGFVLKGANHEAYAELPEEVQLLWAKDLPHQARRRSR